MLLEEQTMKGALDEFLKGRTTALNYILGTGTTAHKPNFSLRKRLALVANLLLQTIVTVEQFFSPEGQVSTTLSKLAAWRPKGMHPKS